jgi:co-chaperonin GroES (HSP10)
MELKQINAVNNKVIVDYLYIEPKGAKSGLVDPNNPNKPIGSQESYEEHPYQAVVIKVPKYFRDNGNAYESEVKEGDVVLLPGFPLQKSFDIFPVMIEQIFYHAVRYHDIQGYYTPTEEQRKNFKFMREVVKKK